jgi:hypothetical protein
MLTSEEFNLQKGFSLAYFYLLKSIRDNDLAAIGECCERNLYRGFVEGFDEINVKVKKMELLNEDKFPKNI